MAMRIHLIGGILNAACGKDLEEVSYTNSASMVTCLPCKKSKIYKQRQNGKRKKSNVKK